MDIVDNRGDVSVETQKLRRALRTLLENKLTFSPCRAGTGVHMEYFLCAEIDDEDIPWDMNEADW